MGDVLLLRGLAYANAVQVMRALHRYTGQASVQ